MVIAKYIGDLLFDYECVVIPGLGGFIINDKPATVNYNTHYFKPPFREVMFNPYLRTNDGLLVNYIAKEENLTYQDAKKKMDAFAIACQNALDSGKQIRFDKVGTIRKDGNGKVVFSQDTSVNYNPNSFGLSPFISPAVNKISDEERIKEAIKKVKNSSNDKAAAPARQKTEKRTDKTPSDLKTKPKNADGKILVARRRSPYRSQFYFILLLLLGMLAGWGVMNKQIVNHYYTQYGSKIPVFYNNAGSYISNNVEILPIKELSKSASGLWLVKLFSKDETETKTASLANDDLTFKDSSKELTAETGNETTKPEAPVEKVEAEKQDATITTPPGKINMDKQVTEESGNEIVEEPPAEETNMEAESVAEAENTEPTAAQAKTSPADNHNDPVVESSPHYSYFIIAGSFKNHNNAVKFIKQLQAKGFVAIIAGTNSYGMTRVAYAGFNTMAEATQQLSRIRQHENPSAWILKK